MAASSSDSCFFCEVIITSSSTGWDWAKAIEGNKATTTKAAENAPRRSRGLAARA